MLSFWPWRGDNSSTASFEKALSSLSAKINATQAQLDRTRSTARRVQVLWSLYLSFAYLIYAIVLVLVVGWTNLGPYEWSGVAGGPVLIYVTRTALSAFFNYRIDSLSTRLKGQKEERAKTVQKLKEATKYDSTLELLEKYGGEPKRPRGKKGSIGGEDGGDKQGEGSKQPTRPGSANPGRTGIAPPPTANIQRRSAPSTPQPSRAAQFPPPREVSAEFAPNAFGPGGPPDSPATMGSAQYAPLPPSAGSEPHWYDRIMDLLLGDDEMAAKNRIVLICAHCRLVNGQAPPGVKTLADVGRWRCMGCRAENGEDKVDECKRLVKEVLAARSGSDAGDQVEASAEFKSDSDGDSSDIVQIDREMAEAEESKGATKRKGKGKK
ncbi:hypothetical protein MCOR27_002588 [Pyricularia oryzae]|uniref:Endoplasmic reticulum junction formation protein lunapark n=2 Tax=Pyricularia TaxID=48558 RepID=A0ABQ8N526_PYRGI|nr:hypothetical protein MCOR01_009372 [Pyricularia oryzae]KAI6291412.1 hypothetical protein MCOR33_010632 [Pyricularia grisea]KAH9437374.1 hypothetical protein MCOR02_001029 [Pyricularia oryzae]KAI6254680.1 hypothetical protein MCOR19_008832 [Pyricularia oryzae]KAI6265055.1 hypothetical protein MCOR26_010961 [Pyricularia oryzae]